VFSTFGGRIFFELFLGFLTWLVGEAPEQGGDFPPVTVVYWSHFLEVCHCYLRFVDVPARERVPVPGVLVNRHDP